MPAVIRKPDPLSTLVDELPSILSEKVHAGGNGRLSRLLSPGEPELDDALLARIDAVVDDRRLSNLPSSTDEEIDALVDELQSMEVDISAQRRAMHERIDTVQAEIVRRYKSGEANVNTLLS